MKRIANEQRNEFAEEPRWTMKRMIKMNSLVARWSCLAFLLGGCGSLSGTGDAPTENEAVGKAELAYTTPVVDACINGCIGAPDGICQAGENNFVCEQDCACGDGQCGGTETPQNCPVDCPYGSDPSAEDDFCGNNVCEVWEHDGLGLDCQIDCHAGPGPAGTVCGNFLCEPGETGASCAADCGNKAACGNYVCEPQYGETFATCDADCTNFNVPAGRFVGTYCSGYDLYSRYANGSGGFDDHLVTTLAGGCDPSVANTAYPWKLVSNAGTCNGSILLKPDGNECTIQGAACNADATWATLGSDYVVAGDPNKCGTYRIHNGVFQPLEWAKVGTKNCAQGGCTEYQCGGQSNQVMTGTRPLWRPQIARWSIYASKCLP
jgi:hypothetical protein